MTWVERQTLFKMGILQNQMEKIGLKIKSVAEYFQNVAHEKTNKYLEIIENRFPMPYNRTKSTVLYFRWVIINLYLNLCHFLKKVFFFKISTLFQIWISYQRLVLPIFCLGMASMSFIYCSMGINYGSDFLVPYYP